MSKEVGAGGRFDIFLDSGVFFHFYLIALLCRSDLQSASSSTSAEIRK